MENAGIIVGCDQNQECLLPWWWHHYSKYNSYPVAFADFGMSSKAISWCLERGSVLTISEPSNFGKKKIPRSNKSLWKKLYGEAIFFYRPAWFKKPLALLQSPFDVGLWLDLDCQVKANVDPIFRTLSFGAEIGVVPEPTFVQDHHIQNGLILPGEVFYNSGVIVFRKNANILHHWKEELTNHQEQYVGDQDALSRAIFLYCPAPSSIQLPFEYNWLLWQGENSNSLIDHFTGRQGKEKILTLMRSSL
jgi:hypothetical protein